MMLVGHMTKMAAMPIYGKNPSKIFSRTSWLISTNLGMQHWGLLPIIVCSDEDPFYCKVKFCNQSFSVRKVKNVDFSETIAACDLKLIELMKILRVLKVKVIS